MYSHHLTYLFKKLHFLKVVLARFCIILFRRRKKLEELYINYDTEHLFDNSYIIIKYRFKNALYYRFGKEVTLEKQIKIFNLKGIDNELDFVVYGLFHKRKYKLKFEPQLTLNNAAFKTNFSHLNLKLETVNIPKLVSNNIKLKIVAPGFNIPKIKAKNKPITIFHKTFNQTDFI